MYNNKQRLYYDLCLSPNQHYPLLNKNTFHIDIFPNIGNTRRKKKGCTSRYNQVIYSRPWLLYLYLFSQNRVYPHTNNCETGTNKSQDQRPSKVRQPTNRYFRTTTGQHGATTVCNVIDGENLIIPAWRSGKLTGHEVNSGTIDNPINQVAQSCQYFGSCTSLRQCPPLSETSGLCWSCRLGLCELCASVIVIVIVNCIKSS